MVSMNKDLQLGQTGKNSFFFSPQLPPPSPPPEKNGLNVTSGDTINQRMKLKKVHPLIRHMHLSIGRVAYSVVSEQTNISKRLGVLVSE